MLGTETIAAIIGGVAVAAFAGGFFIADWKADGEIERLKGSSALLTSANGKCSADLASVNTAVKNIMAEAIARERQAQEAMTQVQPEIERRTAKIIKIRSLPAVKLDMQCEAIEHEQIAYVASRQDEAQ